MPGLWLEPEYVLRTCLFPEPTDFDWEEKLPSPGTSRKNSKDLTDKKTNNPRSPTGKNGYTNSSSSSNSNSSYPTNKTNMSYSKSSNSFHDKSNPQAKIPRSVTCSGERPNRVDTNSLWAPLTDQLTYLTNSFSNLPLMDKM